MTVTPAGEMREALLAGRAAARARQSPHNPYSGTAETARERVLSRMWRLGYSGANPVPVNLAR